LPHRPVKRAPGGDDPPREPLHGRRGGPVSARDRHRPGTALLRRRSRRPRAPDPSGEAPGAAPRGRGRSGRALGPGPRGLPRSGPRRAAGGAGRRAANGEPRARDLPGERPHGRDRAARGGHERDVQEEPRGARSGRGEGPVSVGATGRALPTLFRVGFAEAVAYRAEFLVWMLSTTMPLIMLGLFSAVARDRPI